MGGIVYYISPVRSLAMALSDPIRAVVYILFMVISCGLFSKMWIEIGGNGPKEVARQLKVLYKSIFHLYF